MAKAVVHATSSLDYRQWWVKEDVWNKRHVSLLLISYLASLLNCVTMRLPPQLPSLTLTEVTL
jgi:hypothetical protein